MSRLPDRVPTRRHPIRRSRSSHGRGSIRRYQVEEWLTDYDPVGDNPSERNDARTQYIDQKLVESGVSDKDREAILSDLPSYLAWETILGEIPPWRREV